METPNTNEKSSRPDPEEIKELLEDVESSTNNINATVTTQNEQKDETTRDLEFLYDVPLQISVEVGRCKILLKDLLTMRTGSHERGVGVVRPIRGAGA